KAYARLVENELAKSHAVVEHAGAIENSTLSNIAAAMTKKYARPITATAKPNPALLAGVRVQVGDDVYETSVANQLAALSASV
ncbi:MAG: F0F1 ATP synthase subunit delta, partial [Opitutaceae bacterium]